MGELLTGEGQFRAVGVPGAADTHGATSVTDALEGDLDAYLDRELFVGEQVEVLAEEPAPAASENMRALLDMAAREEAWLETLPPPPTVSVDPEEARAATLAAEAASVVLPDWLKPDPDAPVPAVNGQAVGPAAVCGAATQWGVDASGMPVTPWSVPAESGSPADAYAPRAWHGGTRGDDPHPVPLPGGEGTHADPFRPMIPMGVAPPGYVQPRHPSQPWGMAPVAAVPPAEPPRIFGMKQGTFMGAAAVGALAAGLLMFAGLRLYAPPFHAGALARTAPDVARGSGSNGAGVRDMVPGSTSASMAAPGVAVPTASLASAPVPATGGTATEVGTPTSGAMSVQQGTVAGTALSSAQAASIAGSSPSSARADGQAASIAGSVSSSARPNMQAAAAVAGTVLSSGQADMQAAANALKPGALPTHTPATVSSEPTLASATPRAADAVGSGRKSAAKARLTRTTVLEMDEGATSGRAKPADAEATSSEDDASAVSFESDEESSGDTEESSGTQVASADVTAEDVKPKGAYSELDEDFARELGFTEDSEQKADDAQAQKTVYIPPDPGQASRERLSPEDVTKVVVMNQPAVTACIQQFKAGTAVANGGRFLVRWTVHPSGGVTDVAMDTESLRHTSLGRCIEDQVRAWKFPTHRVALEAPIRFPFVF